jgi:YHS domain-containing protein
MKRIFLVLVIVGFAILTSPYLCMALEDAGNKVCPVTGEKIVEGSKAAYEYKGTSYNLCCSMCVDEFGKDPEKYAAEAAKESGHEDSGHEGRHHH